MWKYINHWKNVGLNVCFWFQASNYPHYKILATIVNWLILSSTKIYFHSRCCWQLHNWTIVSSIFKAQKLNAKTPLENNSRWERRQKYFQWCVFARQHCAYFIIRTRTVHSPHWSLKMIIRKNPGQKVRVEMRLPRLAVPCSYLTLNVLSTTKTNVGQSENVIQDPGPRKLHSVIIQQSASPFFICYSIFETHTIMLCYISA